MLCIGDLHAHVLRTDPIRHGYEQELDRALDQLTRAKDDLEAEVLKEVKDQAALQPFMDKASAALQLYLNSAKGIKSSVVPRLL